MDNKLHYAHTFFCSHLAAVGRASEVQAADKRWQAEKPLTREAYERLSSIYYESFIDSLMQVDGQTSGAVYADTAHLTLETDRLCTLRHPKLPAAEYAFRLCRFHLFFFPYDICLFAMEIAEEPETTLDTLIAAHGILRETSCYEIAEQGILKSQIDAPEYLALLEEILRLCPPRPSVPLRRTRRNERTGSRRGADARRAGCGSQHPAQRMPCPHGPHLPHDLHRSLPTDPRTHRGGRVCPAHALSRGTRPSPSPAGRSPRSFLGDASPHRIQLNPAVTGDGMRTGPVPEPVFQSVRCRCRAS